MENPQMDKKMEEKATQQSAAENVENTVDEVAQDTSSQNEQDALIKERDEWKDKSYRLAAEMENLKKRTEKEVSDAQKYGVSSFARELLEVQDNLERALEVLENSGMENEKLAPVVEGVTMVKTQLNKAFDRMKIQRIDCVGQKLDPELHQAVMQIPSEEEAGTVVQEIQSGYMISERLLRPAMVGVATKKEG